MNYEIQEHIEALSSSKILEIALSIPWLKGY